MAINTSHESAHGKDAAALGLGDDEQIVLDKIKTIATQNDRFRFTWGADYTIPGRIVMTPGIADMTPAAKAIVMQRVQHFNTFTEDNDPYEDHTFGAFEFEIAGNSYNVFWKIDLYDKAYEFGSDDPSNTEVTRRVLTIMLASEY